MVKYNYVVMIPARGGSKSIPLKNIKENIQINILYLNQKLHNMKKTPQKLRCLILIYSQHAGRLNIHTCSSQVGSAQLASAIF